MTYRDTSRQAYRNLSDLGQRQLEVYKTIEALKEACNLDIANALGLPINSITGRTRELYKDGFVIEARKAKGPTGRTVTFWKIKKDTTDWEAKRLEVVERIKERKSYNFGLFS